MISPKSYIHVLVPLLLIPLLFNLSNSIEIQPHDKEVLLHIKNFLQNPSYLSQWDANTTDWCDLWNGPKCNEQGHVTALAFNNLIGQVAIPPFLDELPWLTDLSFLSPSNTQIPPYIGKLTNLTSFTLTWSNITGPIPSSLGRLQNLEHLDLSNNKFTGHIPNFIGRLKKLNFIDLSSNSLTGSIPNSLGQLKSLFTLSMCCNNLTGPVPLAFAEFTNLQNLDLSANQLSGSIPDFLGQKLQNLNQISLSFNLLSGSIPASIGSLPNLRYLYLTKNQLSGSIPMSLGSSNLVTLWLDSNKLTGDASFLFENISRVSISDNHLKFDLSNVVMAPYMQMFDISHNMIYGSLPKLFYRILVDYEDDNTVDVSYNQLCGPIPNGRRLKLVDPKIFSHNKCLCGGPLKACK